MGEEGRGRPLVSMGVMVFAKSLGKAVWVIWHPPEWDPKVSPVWKPLDFPSLALSFSHWMAEGIRTYSPFSLERKTCHLALRRRSHLTLVVHYLYHVLGCHILKDKKKKKEM